MKIKVLTFEVKMNKKNEAYYLLKCEDKHSYNLPGKLGTPALNGVYEAEYEETEYEYQGKKVKSKWISKFMASDTVAQNHVEQAQAILGGKIKETKPITSGETLLIDNKMWDDAIKIVGCFITGKEGDLAKVSEMVKTVYNELLKTKAGLS